MKKLLLIMIFIIGMLHAKGFTRLTVIKPTMPSQAITNLLVNAQDGTVFEFESGMYTNIGNNINIENKHYIALRAAKDANVTFQNSIISLKNTEYLKIKGIDFKNNSAIVLSHTNNFVLNHLYFYNSAISIVDGSMGLIHKCNFNEDEKNMRTPIYIKNDCNVLMRNLKVTNNSKLYTIQVRDESSARILNSEINASKSLGVLDYNYSKMIILNTHFDGLSNVKDNYHYAVEIEKNSQLSASHNIFQNWEVDIWTSNSILQIVNNKFLDSDIGIYAKKNSDLLLQYNTFDKLWAGVQLHRSFAHSTSNLFSNSTYGIMDEKFSSIEIKKDFFKNITKIGIDILNTAAAYIYEVKHRNCKLFGYAAEYSRIYSKSYSDISLPGIGDPQVMEFPIFQLARYAVKGRRFIRRRFSPINIDFSLSAHLLKGYTKNPIKFWNKDGEQEIVNKNTYMIFDKVTNKIVKPDEYKGVELKSNPELAIKKEQRKIVVSPKITTKGNKRYISFRIVSNGVLKSLKFDNVDMNILSYDPSSYTTSERRIRNKKSVYPLIIEGNNYALNYECKRDDPEEIQCEPFHKGDL